ncbi:MAG: N-acetylmuramoyl-L-alanine amidase [Stenotrophomonas sp.]
MLMRTARAGCLSVAALLAASFSVQAARLQGINLESGASGTRAEIVVDSQGSYRTLSLTQPYRLVVDFEQSTLASNLKLPAASGIVTSVRTGNPTPGTVRVVFELSAPVQAMPAQWVVGAQPTLVLQWPGSTPAASASTPASPPPAAQPPAAGAVSPTPADSAAQTRAEAARATALLTASATQISTPTAAAGGAAGNPASILQGAVVNTPPPPPSTGATEATPARVEPAPTAPVAATPGRRAPVVMGAGMRELVVAIDAGHGGQDPGAVGPTGKHEKNVTLAVARELARQVDATPGLRAFLVRDSDVFIPLNARAARARQAKADIFISIHADAAENRNARGSSVYVLSTKGASSQRARWLADKENAADLIGGVALRQAEGTLANVLLDLAQSGQQKASEEAAEQVLSGLKRIGNNHKPNIERANFAVLRTADMPAMLVETAFISNPDEERRLFQPAFQRQLAAAVLDGVHTYFSRQPPPGTLFAAQAEAESARGNTGRGSP